VSAEGFRKIGLSLLAGDSEERGRVVEVEKGVLAFNQRLAEENRARFDAAGVKVVNVLSSPGSGKTTFLARTLRELPLKAGVIVGDLATDRDAERLRTSGAPAVQIQTGGVCHLEAAMVARAAALLDLEALEVLFIENVGNLVCPASYDLGEHLRVVLFSVTEGEDKPLKYPTMFKTAQAVVISKVDLADAVGFAREQALGNVRQVNPKAAVLEVSAKTGQGMEGWYAFLQAHLG
jgi:hydrogenase nickel incorporation protein HypB